MKRVNLLRAHGTRNRYQRGCRCSLCRKANSEHKAAWYRANPESAKRSLKKYYETNRDAILAKDKAYVESHREQYREYNRRSYQKYAEDRRKKHAEYRKAHPEVIRASTLRHLARKRNAEGDHTADDIAAQYERQHGKCFWCKKKVEHYHVDHVVPLSKGGSNGPENLVVSCALCNQTKNARHPMDFAGVML